MINIDALLKEITINVLVQNFVDESKISLISAKDINYSIKANKNKVFQYTFEDNTSKVITLLNAHEIFEGILSETYTNSNICLYPEFLVFHNGDDFVITLEQDEIIKSTGVDINKIFKQLDTLVSE